jgi:hypothetical protein
MEKVPVVDRLCRVLLSYLFHQSSNLILFVLKSSRLNKLLTSLFIYVFSSLTINWHAPLFVDIPFVFFTQADGPTFSFLISVSDFIKIPVQGVDDTYNVTKQPLACS